MYLGQNRVSDMSPMMTDLNNFEVQNSLFGMKNTYPKNIFEKIVSNVLLP